MADPVNITFAAVMTGKGAGAIATIELFGGGARGILEKIFTGGREKQFEAGSVLVGDIIDVAVVIDQVTVGCKGENNFAIHAHGNPLIVADIMELLKSHDAELISAEEMIAKTSDGLSTIEVEARIVIAGVKTLEGTKIVADQVSGGLSGIAKKWSSQISDGALIDIQRQAKDILADSEIAKLVIFGATVVLTGPPNAGKSSLLNALAGREKAIVTHIEGTTRDYVTAGCRIGDLFAELIDTAGLDDRLDGVIEVQAQQMSLDLCAGADLVLMVIDSSRAVDDPEAMMQGKLADKKKIFVLNKSDLPTAASEEEFEPSVKISALTGHGVEDLKQEILRQLGACEIETDAAIAFTSRQEELLRKIISAKDAQIAAASITELLNGPLRV